MQTVIVTPPARPENSIALVCDSPHSGTHYPDDFRHAVDRAALRRSEDTDIDALWSAVPEVGGTLVCATFPRSYLDPNRDEADIDVAMIEGEWPREAKPSARCLDLGNGLVWRSTPQHLPIYDRLLSADEVIARIENCWRPYRRAVSDAIERAAATHGGCWHLNLHSMPSNAYERLGLGPGKELADVVLGDRRGTTCSAGFRDVVAQAFRDRGYSVAINDPYEGVELVRIHGEPARQRHSLQIELKRSLYMEESTRERGPGFLQLQAGIRGVLDTVRGYVVEQTAALRRGHGQAQPAT